MMDHGNTANTEIDERERVAELEAEVARLRAAEDTAERALSTRELSPVKPTDHQPAAEDLVKLEHKGVTYQVRKKALGNLRLIDLMERNQLASALRMLVGDEKFGEFMESVDDGTGYVDVEECGPLLEAIAEKAGSKN